MSVFTRSLVVSPLADGRTWVILRPFGYDVGREGSGDRIRVETGFMTDFASIPRIFWIFLPCWGRYGNAAVIHDWLYWTGERPRQEADRIMLEAMSVLSVPGWQKYSIYYAVRAFGGLAWKRNRWDREAGFRRVLVDYGFKAKRKSDRPGLLSRSMQRFRKNFLRG